MLHVVGGAVLIGLHKYDINAAARFAIFNDLSFISVLINIITLLLSLSPFLFNLITN